MINTITLVGHLGRDPEIVENSENKICNLSIATTSSWKDRDGVRQNETEWHRVVFYGRLAEIASEYLRKGKLVYVVGRVKTRKWQDKDTGQDRYSTEVIGKELKMLDRSEGDDDNIIEED